MFELASTLPALDRWDDLFPEIAYAQQHTTNDESGFAHRCNVLTDG